MPTIVVPRAPARPVFLVVALLALVPACSPGGDAGDGDAVADTTPLTTEELEKGVGPVRSVELAVVPEPALAAEGERLYRSRCVACHLIDDRSVGPPLGDVTERRAPEYVMNMILNPEEMVRRHPEARALKDRFVTPMPDQGLTRQEARAVLEYLRAASRPPGSVE